MIELQKKTISKMIGSIVKSLNLWFKIFLAYQANDNKGTG